MFSFFFFFTLVISPSLNEINKALSASRPRLSRQFGCVPGQNAGGYNLNVACMKTSIHSLASQEIYSDKDFNKHVLFSDLQFISNLLAPSFFFFQKPDCISVF